MTESKGWAKAFLCPHCRGDDIQRIDDMRVTYRCLECKTTFCLTFQIISLHDNRSNYDREVL